MFELVLCACGCGNPAPLAKKTNAKLGQVKGAPLKYLHNHHTRGKYPDITTRLGNYEVDQKTGCYRWLGATNSAGYGVLYYLGKLCLAHRVTWEVSVGPIEEGLSVCHKCDTPGCINPSHLFLGTHQDNMEDMRKKGRAPLQKTPKKYTKAALDKAVGEWLAGKGTQEEVALANGIPRGTLVSHYRSNKEKLPFLI